MKKNLLKVALAFFSAMFMHLCVVCQQTGWQQDLRYQIDARFDPAEKSIDGFLELNYRNNSPDTLHFIWFNIWPNAFKSDRTAYSEHLLEAGTTDFYFANDDSRGYINRLDFKSDDRVLEQEDHPLHLDIVKVKLENPLPPGGDVSITTPFHVKLPRNFSGVGYSRGIYHVQFWYPAPALYDSEGWHLSPYTNQQQSSAQPGSYTVNIDAPPTYIINSNAGSVAFEKKDSLQTAKLLSSRLTDCNLVIQRQGAQVKTAAPKTSLDDKFNAMLPRLLAHRFLPAAGYNMYDGIQLGFITHNFAIPNNKLTYYVAPLFAFNSSTVTGIGGINYEWKKEGKLSSIKIGLDASTFSNLEGKDSAGKKVFGFFAKQAPYLRIGLRSRSASVEKWIELRSFIISERDFEYHRYSQDSLFYPAAGATAFRYLNQLSFHYESSRVLYPYDVRVQLQQASSFYRINATANYFFNYPKGGGLKMRVFAGKFGYLGSLSAAEKFETVRYQPKLTAARGSEDYTYSNVFVGRNEFEGFAAQQMMVRDGGLKIRTDIFQDLQGRSDNWIASMNLNTTLPSGIFPVKLPLRVFLDVGTHAEAWKRGSANPRFLYVAGLQVPLFKDLLNIYAPVLMSRQFRDNLKTVPEENKFLNRISFSIDIHRFSLRKVANQTKI